MKIVNKHIDDLIPYDYNPRHIDDEAVERVANSIREFGIKQPLVIDKTNVIIVGHTRLKACELLEIEEVPCIVADDLTRDQINAYRLADNKVAEFTNWDLLDLRVELAGIDLSMEQFGFEEYKPPKRENKVQISFKYNQKKGDYIKSVFASNKEIKKDIAERIYKIVKELDNEDY